MLRISYMYIVNVVRIELQALLICNGYAFDLAAINIHISVDLVCSTVLFRFSVLIHVNVLMWFN